MSFIVDPEASRQEEISTGSRHPATGNPHERQCAQEHRENVTLHSYAFNTQNTLDTGLLTVYYRHWSPVSREFCTKLASSANFCHFSEYTVVQKTQTPTKFSINIKKYWPVLIIFVRKVYKKSPVFTFIASEF